MDTKPSRFRHWIDEPREGRLPTKDELASLGETYTWHVLSGEILDSSGKRVRVEPRSIDDESGLQNPQVVGAYQNLPAVRARNQRRDFCPLGDHGSESSRIGKQSKHISVRVYDA